MDLAELIISSKAYLSCFDYDHYPACFQTFEAESKAFFETLKDSEIRQAAVALIRELERRRAVLSRREQKHAEADEKQVLALFLAPAAALHSELARSFAEALMLEWNARYPRNTFLLGSYETILKGFDANLLGLPLRKSKTSVLSAGRRDS